MKTIGLIGAVVLALTLAFLGFYGAGATAETSVKIQTRVHAAGSSVKTLTLPSTIESLALEIQQVGTSEVTRTVHTVTTGQAVTLTANVTAGVIYVFTIKAYESTDGSGTVLYDGRVTTTVVAGQAVKLGIVLGPPDPVSGIPTITAKLPVDGASNVAPLSEISATFSESMNAVTVTTTTFPLVCGGTTVSGAVFFNHIKKKAFFTPSEPLTLGTTCTATVTTGMTDTVGIPLTTSVTWQFTVRTSNAVPTANAGPDQAVPLAATVALDGSGSSDGDSGDVLTFAWSLTSVPTGSSATLSDSTAEKLTFVLDKFGTYVAQLIVNDGSVNSTADTVTITVLPRAYVSDPGTNNSVVVIDLATETEIANIVTGGDPYWIASSADRSVVATSLHGSTGVALIDATTNTLLGVVGSVGSEPEAVAVNSTGTTVYVADESGEDLYVVDVASKTVTAGPIDLSSPCSEPERMVISPDNAFLYITCAGSSVIRVVIAGFGITTIASGLGDPHGIALNADGTRLYYTNTSGSGTTFEYDTGLQTLTGITFSGCDLYGGAVSPDGTRLYCVEEGSSLLIYDTSDGSLLATVALGSSSARDVAVHPDGSLVYVPLSGADAVEVIDAVTKTNLSGNISVSGASPNPRGITIR